MDFAKFELQEPNSPGRPLIFVMVFEILWVNEHRLGHFSFKENLTPRNVEELSDLGLICHNKKLWTQPNLSNRNCKTYDRPMTLVMAFEILRVDVCGLGHFSFKENLIARNIKES
ncbi:hypothetical protein KI387_034278, partial [Taxus chinensis]